MQQIPSHKTILIVEDSPTQALHIRRLLEQYGLNTLLANNGRFGVYVAQRMLPDLVLLDIQMPEMDGLEVCQILKSSPETMDIPVVMLSARDEQETATRSLALGAVDYIPKDIYSDETLLNTLRQLRILEEDVELATG